MGQKYTGWVICIFADVLCFFFVFWGWQVWMTFHVKPYTPFNGKVSGRIRVMIDNDGQGSEIIGAL